MERQKSMEAGLLRKSLSIRERKHPNEDGSAEAGLLRKSLSIRESGFTPKGHPTHPIHKDLKKHQIEEDECCVTLSVCLITFIVATGSFCVGCGVSKLLLSWFSNINSKVARAKPVNFTYSSKQNLLI